MRQALRRGWLLGAAVSLGACVGPVQPPASLPISSVPPTDSPAFATFCAPKPLVPGGGPYLTCRSAIDAALAVLPQVHAPMSLVSFQYDCPGPGDCAVWLFGVVQVRFANAPSLSVLVRVSMASDGHVATTVPVQVIQNE